MDKKTIKQFLIFLLFFCLLGFFIGFTFYDLQTSKALFIGENSFSIAFAYLGKLPSFVLIFISALLLSKTVNSNYTEKIDSLKWLYRLFAFFGATMFFYSIFENFIIDTLTLILSAASSGLALTIVGIICLSFLQRKKLIKLEKWALFTLIFVILVFGAASVLKLAIGRIRFIDLTDDTKFKFWYNFDFFGDGNSFPSGHVALASTLVSVCVLLKTLNVKLYQQIIINALCFAFVICTLITRVLAGHHYMTDVIASLIISFTIFFVLYFILYKNKKFEFDNTTKAEKAFNLGIK